MLVKLQLALQRWFKSVWYNVNVFFCGSMDASPKESNKSIHSNSKFKNPKIPRELRGEA